MVFSFLRYLFFFFFVPLKQFNTQSGISLEILNQCSFNLALEMYITKETKLQLSCHCHDNSYATGPVLITTKIRRFHLTQGSSTPNNHLMGRIKTMWEPCLFQGRPPVLLKKVANRDIWFFTERDWSQWCCHGNNIVGVILFLS